MTYKVCKICGIEKSLDDFYLHGGYPSSYCKVCERLLSRRWIAEHKDEKALYDKNYAKLHYEEKKKIDLKYKHKRQDETLKLSVQDLLDIQKYGVEYSTPKGYVQTHYKGYKIKTHRLNFCIHKGCSLADIDDLEIHHLDGNTLNNAPANLVALNLHVHKSIHSEDHVVIGEGTVIWKYVNILPGARIGSNCSIGSYTEIGKDVIIGNNCKIQAHVFIPKGVSIGNNVFIGPGVTMVNDRYPSALDYGLFEKTIVEDDANIGAGATIRCGITIGRGATIGAGSVVTKDVPPGATVKGVAAK